MEIFKPINADLVDEIDKLNRPVEEVYGEVMTDFVTFFNLPVQKTAHLFSSNLP